jgi:hypothetical protein
MGVHELRVQLFTLLLLLPTLCGWPSINIANSADFASCDFGGDLPTPVLAYNFNSVDRTVSCGFGCSTNYHESSSKAASISPTANHEIKCSTAFIGPYCGTLIASGGPGGVGLTPNAYYDLSIGSGTAHRGFVKAVDATEEDYHTDNEFTISIFVKLDARGFGTYLVSKLSEFTFTGNPWDSGGTFVYDSHLCASTFSDTSANCAWLSGTDMLEWDADGVWTHYAYVYDGPTSHKIYKNGVLGFERTGTSSTIGNFGSGLSIGAVNTWGVDGGIDEFSIFDEALDASQILALSTCVIPE